MGLRDRDGRRGGKIENLDRYLTQLGDRFGNFWLDRTGLSRTSLTGGLYFLAAWAATQHIALVHDPMMAIFVLLPLLGAGGIAPSRGGLVEQIQIEAAGLPRLTLIALRLWILALGMLSFAIALGDIAVALQTRAPLPGEVARTLLAGVAFTALQAGDYIRRTNPLFPSGGHRRRA